MNKLKKIGFGLLTLLIVTGAAFAYAELRPMTVERAQLAYDNATSADDAIKAAGILTAKTKHDALCILTRTKIFNGVKLKNEENIKLCKILEK